MSSEPAGGGPALWDQLARGAGSSRSSLYCWTGDRYEPAPWAQVVRDAEAMTAGLRRAGIGPGSRVATVLTNTPWAIRGLFGAWLAGGMVASLPVPSRGMSAAEYTRQLSAIAAQIDPVAFLADERMLSLLPEDLRAALPFRSWESLAGSGTVAAAPPGTDEPAFVQYSSGSTSTPKGCVLTPRAIAAQLDIVKTMIGIRPRRDVAVTWLPLSHDMGLFGFLLTCWWNDIDCYLSTPERFMFSPGTWFSDMAQTGSTLTVGSNTALYLAARAASRSSRLSPAGLAQARAVIIGAERVEWSTLRYATEVLGPHGFRASALMPAYGLAEATLAVTATPVLDEPRRVAVEAACLADGEVREADPDDPAASVVVSSGRPCRGVTLPGMESGQLTEIAVSSPSLATGYWGNEQLTSARFAGGAVLTADLGFVRDGWLYPVGRTDDVLSVAGRKVYAREIEIAVDGIEGVRRGCCALVGHHDGVMSRLTLFVEVARERDDYRALAEQAASLAMAKASVALDGCVFLGRNSLPKTPSGKIQRHRCRDMFEAGRFNLLSVVDLAPA
jgi:fatty-acyl-CoA synthase